MKSDYVLLCDSRDVLFQKNIECYKVDSNYDIFFTEEDKIIDKCNINKNWLKLIETSINESFIENIKEKTIICSGTIFGTIKGISNFLDIICDTMSNIIKIDEPGLDQGIVNYLLYTNKLNDIKYKLLSNKTSDFVNTLQYGIQTIENNYIINYNKDVTFIVHQWDRLEKNLWKQLIDIYSQRGYNFKPYREI